MNKMPVTDFGENACKSQYYTAISHTKRSINFDILQLEQRCWIASILPAFWIFNFGGCNSDKNNLSLCLTFLPEAFQFDLLPDTFQFDLFTGYISVWPFYRTNFSFTFLLDTFQFDLFTRSISVLPFTGQISVWCNLLDKFQFDVIYRTHFSLTFLPGTFQFDLFTGHISVWPFYRIHFSLTFSLPGIFQFDLQFTGHISVWPFYREEYRTNKDILGYVYP